MTQNTQHHRRSIRLHGYNYTSAGTYFVTICTRHRECLFGDVVDGEMRVNAWGQTIVDCWHWLAEQYTYVNVDSWIVMPNHIHGIITITDDVCRGGSRTAPTYTMIRKPLGRIIGAFKTVSTKRINASRRAPGVPLWQRNYYERIIRNTVEMDRIREYIGMNPSQWADDENHPGAQHISSGQR